MRAAVRFAAFVVPMLLVLYLAFQPPERHPDAMSPAPAAPNPSGTASGTAVDVDAEATPAPARPAGATAELSGEIVIDWNVPADGEVQGPRLVKLALGDPVALRVRSATDDVMHLHGYDLTQPIPAGQVAALRFAATSAGRFELELHHSHRTLAVLEVRPR